MFAESKRAEGKENQDVAMEETDDIHDMMVGSRTSRGGGQGQGHARPLEWPLQSPAEYQTAWVAGCSTHMRV